MAPNPAPPDSEGPPTLAVASGVATITLRRPSQRNSLHDADLRALVDHCAAIDADTAIRVVVLRAVTAGQARPVFSAGYNVGSFEGEAHDPHLFEHVPEAIEHLRPPTVCALGGSVYGGATDFVLACDLRVALAGAEWRMPAVALGLHYYPGGLRRYVTRFGLNAAKRAFLTARPLPVEALATLGLFEEVAAADRFDAAVDELVQTLAGLAPLAAQATKRSLNEIAAGLFDEAALRGRETLTAGSADFAEGRAAFAERRRPRFKGR